MEKVLVVDDEATLRDMFSAMLSRAGYSVSTAVDGFDALLQMRKEVPDVLISDLNMPRMSGFELLSVVRRRFPEVCVLAMSGAFLSNATPTGIIADGFLQKGEGRTIVEAVAQVCAVRNGGGFSGQHKVAPVWLPRNGRDSKGVPYIVLTCTDCLRSFPLSVKEEDPTHEARTTPCIFCQTMVTYIVDFSLDIVSPPPGGVRP